VGFVLARDGVEQVALEASQVMHILKMVIHIVKYVV
jgi:hypothetical protein